MTKLFELYPHQDKAINDLYGSFKQGMTRPLLYAATAVGKTVIAAHIVARALDKGKKVVFVVPYTALINQTARSFMKQGLPQPGIIQASHEWTNYKKRLQIASIQTLARRGFPQDVDLFIIDECHLVFKAMVDHLNDCDTPVIGLSGTPFSRGLGRTYDNLIKTKSMSDLIDDGFLSQYIVYAPDQPDLTAVTVRKGDYVEKEIAKVMSEAKITGSITNTWIKRGNNEPTLCFACNVAHANHLHKEFAQLGISSTVITAKTQHDEREEIFKAFKDGEIKILINVGVLVAGFDSDVRCLIYARPTKSMIVFTQIIGRSLRTADGKSHAIILDHTGTFQSLGFPEEYEFDELCTLEKGEKATPKAREKIEKLPKPCPKCDVLKEAGQHECFKCGFTPVFSENVEQEDGELHEITRSRKITQKVDKQRIYSELLGFQQAQLIKGKGCSDGRIAHIYKEMVGVWPRSLNKKILSPSDQVLGFIKHKQIAFAKSRNKGK